MNDHAIPSDEQLVALLNGLLFLAVDGEQKFFGCVRDGDADDALIHKYDRPRAERVWAKNVD